MGRPCAIVLDEKVLSAPVICEPITGGPGQISGGFSAQEAGTLAALLRAGALPAKLTVIEERSVGADLGSNVIRKGVLAGVGAFVFVFMVVLFGGWSLRANAALALNGVLTIAGMRLLGATLTLPGIAGIVRGIGLTVDANVLIKERIREETLKGKAALTAIDAGFRRACATVMDSKVTALIATVLLFSFGSGPVRGFAITMALGSLMSLARPGLNFGIDFRGGIQMEVAVSRLDDLPRYRAELDTLGLGEVSLQTMGEGDRLLVRVERQPGGEVQQTEAVERLKEAMRAIDPQASFERSEVVGPKLSGELTRAHGHRGAAHAGGLFGERQGRGLRPHA